MVEFYSCLERGVPLAARRALPVSAHPPPVWALTGQPPQPHDLRIAAAEGRARVDRRSSGEAGTGEYWVPPSSQQP